jgi:hypothetical protein
MTTILQFIALLLYLASSSKIQLSNCLVTLPRSQHAQHAQHQHQRQHQRQQQQPSSSLSSIIQSLRLRRSIIVANNFGGGRISRNRVSSSFLTGHQNNNDDDDISTGREDFNDEDNEINNSRNHHDDNRDSKKIDDNNDGDNNSNDNPTTTILSSSSSLLTSSDVSLLKDPGLWISDFMALILASQLIGLLGVINSPEFIQNGGWFQPISAIPSTLDDLVQRISTFGIVWGIAFSSTIFLVSVVNTKQLSTSTSTTASVAAAMKINKLYPNKEKQNITSSYRDSDRNNTTILLQRNIQTLIIFGIFRIMLGVIFSELHNDHNHNDVITIIGSGQTSIEWLDILRDCYYIGLFTSTLRYLYSRLFLF